MPAAWIATLDVLNELELRKLLLLKLTPQELITKILTQIFDTTVPWEDRRSLWMFLYLSQRPATLMTAMKDALENKQRIPFELLIQISDQNNEKPRPVVLEALFKGMKKQGSLPSLFAARAWDKWDKRFAAVRKELIQARLEEKKRFKEGLLEKFWFLHSQRMSEQAGRTLRRLVELFPEDQEIQKLKRDHEEQWARDVLSTHMATLQMEKIERTQTANSTSDQDMVKCFLAAGEKHSLENRDAALELAYAFIFMEEHSAALEMLNWAAPAPALDWLRAELLFNSRRFIEALEQLNLLEIKFVEDPETTFAVSYLRARCLKALGQHGPALEILQSIVRVRPAYRSAHALILEWREGASWE